MSGDHRAQRCRLHEWLKAVTSATGPKPQRLRHACHVLACFMRGDGTAGCFPGTRKVGEAMAVSQATASRDLRALERQGWVVVNRIPGQFGKVRCHYYPAVPMSLYTDSMNGANESAIETHSNLNESAPSANESKTLGNESRARLIESPSVTPKSQSEISTEKITSHGMTRGAASPSPVEAGSAAQKPEPWTDQSLRWGIQNMRKLGWSDDRILKKYARFGMTAAHFAATEATRTSPTQPTGPAAALECVGTCPPHPPTRVP